MPTTPPPSLAAARSQIRPARRTRPLIGDTTQNVDERAPLARAINTTLPQPSQLEIVDRQRSIPSASFSRSRRSRRSPPPRNEPSQRDVDRRKLHAGDVAQEDRNRLQVSVLRVSLNQPGGRGCPAWPSPQRKYDDGSLRLALRSLGFPAHAPYQITTKAPLRVPSGWIVGKSRISARASWRACPTAARRSPRRALRCALCYLLPSGQSPSFPGFEPGPPSRSRDASPSRVAGLAALPPPYRVGISPCPKVIVCSVVPGTAPLAIAVQIRAPAQADLHLPQICTATPIASNNAAWPPARGGARGVRRVGELNKVLHVRPINWSRVTPFRRHHNRPGVVVPPPAAHGLFIRQRDDMAAAHVTFSRRPSRRRGPQYHRLATPLSVPSRRKELGGCRSLLSRRHTRPQSARRAAA